MSLYSNLFSQFGINSAQVLVQKSDFEDEFTLKNLQSTLKDLLDSKTVPILNTNDAVALSPEKSKDINNALNINDNDSLAARLAVMINSDLLLIMSDVDGVFNSPPSNPGSRLIHTFSPKFDASSVNFGEKSNVGTGGMESKIKAAGWAVENDCSVLICNGKMPNAILKSVNGEKIGTFFTNSESGFLGSSSLENITIKGAFLFFF